MQVLPRQESCFSCRAPAHRPASPCRLPPAPTHLQEVDVVLYAQQQRAHRAVSRGLPARAVCDAQCDDSLCRNGAQRHTLCLAGPLPQAATLLTCSPQPWPGARPTGRARSGPSAAGPRRSGRRRPRHGRAAGPACCAGGGPPLLGSGPIHPNYGAHGGRRLGPHRALGPPPGAGGLPGQRPWRQQGAAMP